MRLDPERFRRTYWVTRNTPKDRRSIDDLVAAGIEVHELNRASKTSVWAWTPLLSFLRERRVDILHTHKFGSNVWGALLGRLAAVPVVVANEHTWSYEGQPVRRFLDRELISRTADVFVAVSEEDRRRMIEVEGIQPHKIRVLPIAPWAFSLRSPSMPSSDVRKDLGIAPGTPVIGAVGGLRTQKAYDVLLGATATLAAEFPGLKVLIAGGGPEAQTLRHLTTELGLDESVSFLGRWDPRRIPDLLAGLDVAVNCSDYEGTPASIVEFMAAGLPVVATNVGGTPDVIEHGVHGLLIQPRDPTALAGAIADLLRDDERRAQMGARAKERQAREFDISVLVTRIEDLYESLWAQHQGRRREGRHAEAAAHGPGRPGWRSVE